MAAIECRVCGSRWPRAAHVAITSGGGCPTCAGSPLCDSCGHPRRDHAKVFVKGGERQCRRRIGDFQTLTSSECSCGGYVPVEGALGQGSFARPDPDVETPLPPLRIVPR